jgi:hypothetical protein
VPVLSPALDVVLFGVDPIRLSLRKKAVAYWKLGEASGSRADSTGWGNTLTDVNTVTQAAGKVGNAAQFTRVNAESLTLADNVDLSTGNISFGIACWVYLDTKATQQGILVKWGGAGLREYYLEYNSGADRFRFHVSNDGTADAVVIANALGSPSVGTWYFIVCWHDADADTINIQVNDGTVNSTAHATGVFDSTWNFAIGNLVGLFLDGRVDEAGVYKPFPTAAERTWLYNGGSGRSLY